MGGGGGAGLLSGQRHAAVRIGNVLRSSGSVVPIFRRQITAGRAGTATDLKMTRYFMTIPEAVQLIIRSGELALGGEVFVLDMDDPVKIIDLARNMIRLSGNEPDIDITVEIVGRRPGEKVHEGVVQPRRRPQFTPAEKIVSAVRPPLDPSWSRALPRAHRGAGLQRRRGGARECRGRARRPRRALRVAQPG